MPLPKRIIDPVHVTRNTLPVTNVPGITITSELEAVANGALANIIRQLSSLSQHAENVFVELSVIATGMFERTASLQTRVDRLSMKVTALDSNVEEVSLQDIHMRKAFKSAVIIDQQLFAKTSLPDSIRSVYEQCDEPPPLNLLNCYRDDGKDGLKFYTDPNYFFELWRQEMINDTERMMHDKNKRFRPKNMLTSTSTLNSNEVRHKKRVRQPHNTRERQKQTAMIQGEYIMSSATIGQQHYATTMQQQKNQSQAQQALYYATLRNTSNNIRTLMRPSSMEVQQQYIYGNHQHTNGDDLDSSLSQMNLSNNSDHYHRPHNHVVNHDEYVYNHNQEPIYGSNQLLSPSRRIRPSQPPPAPPPNQQLQQQQPEPEPEPSSLSHTLQTSNSNTPNKTHQYSTPNINRGNLPPPPPPPPLFAETESELTNDSTSYYYDENDKNIADEITTTTTPPPPPPPPPPMPMPIANNVSGCGSLKHETVAPLSKITNGDLLKTISTLSPPKLKPVTNSIMAPDPRNELLQAIRSGIKLRKVEKNEQKSASINANSNGLHDVASILSRRVAVEYSDSDTSSQNDDDSEYDSDCWAVGDARQQRNSIPATSGASQSQQQKEPQQQQQPQSVSQLIT